MTLEDPIPLKQDPMQSWIGVAHSGGYVLLPIRVVGLLFLASGKSVLIISMDLGIGKCLIYIGPDFVCHNCSCSWIW